MPDRQSESRTYLLNFLPECPRFLPHSRKFRICILAGPSHDCQSSSSINFICLTVLELLIVYQAKTVHTEISLTKGFCKAGCVLNCSREADSFDSARDTQTW